jgi:hypothetical protein
MAELERRHEQEVELAPRIGDGGVLFEPGERRRVQIEDRVAVARDLRRIRFAVKHAELPAVPLRRLDLEPARAEREQVCRQRRRLREPQPEPPAVRGASGFRAVGDRLPSVRNHQGEAVLCLDVWRIEAGKREPRARRHEQRVHELGVAVQRRVAGGEVEGDLVRARAQRRGGNDDVLVRGRHRNALAIRGRLKALHRAGEIERQRPRRIGEREAHDRPSRDWLRRDRRDVERQLVTDVLQSRRALLRQRQRHAGVRRLRRGSSLHHHRNRRDRPDKKEHVKHAR